MADFSSVETPVDGQGMALDISLGAGAPDSASGAAPGQGMVPAPEQTLGLYRGQYAALELTYGTVVQSFEGGYGYV